MKTDQVKQRFVPRYKALSASALAEMARNNVDTAKYMPPKTGKRDVAKSFTTAIQSTLKYEYLDETVIDQMLRRDAGSKLPLVPELINIDDEIVEELLKYPQ